MSRWLSCTPVSPYGFSGHKATLNLNNQPQAVVWYTVYHALEGGQGWLEFSCLEPHPGLSVESAVLPATLCFCLVFFFSPSCPPSAIGPVTGVCCSLHTTLCFCLVLSLHLVHLLLLAQSLPAFQNVSQSVCVFGCVCV